MTNTPLTNTQPTNTPRLRPLGEALGTEALGIDLSKPLDAAQSAWIAQAFAEHPVLVFRDQDLGANELRRVRSLFRHAAPARADQIPPRGQFRCLLAHQR